MKALCWNGVNNLKTETIPDPEIVNPHDVIVKVSLSSVCGSDLHFIHGLIPTMRKGDVLGHEFMGEVVETGPEIRTVKKGDRVVVPSVVSCGECWYCRHEQWISCENSNPNGVFQEPLQGYHDAAIYGCSHQYGGYAGSHAEYIRVPYGDVDCFKVPESLNDTQALFISDAAPTGYMGAVFCDIRPGDVVAVWGCGGVGLMAQQSAFHLGAERVIAIDRLPDRLCVAKEKVGSETIDFSKVDDVVDVLKEMTGGRGPDHCIDAVGMEAHGTGLMGAYDKVKQSLYLHTDRGEALRQAMRACRKGGTLVILGVYVLMDKFPLFMLLNKNITVRTSQQNGHKYVPELLNLAEQGKFDPSFLATHRFPLEEGIKAYDLFRDKEDGCIRAVFTPA